MNATTPTIRCRRRKMGGFFSRLWNGNIFLRSVYTRRSIVTPTTAIVYFNENARQWFELCDESRSVAKISPRRRAGRVLLCVCVCVCVPSDCAFSFRIGARVQRVPTEHGGQLDVLSRAASANLARYENTRRRVCPRRGAL